MRRAHRLDSNHQAVADALRARGVLVLSLAGLGDGAPDLLCCTPSRWHHLTILELKDGSKPPSKRALTADQETFRAQGWPVVTVTSVDEALRAVGIPYIGNDNMSHRIQ